MHTKSQSRVVIVGGGFGGVFTAIELTGDADVTLISRSENFTFTPLLYEYLSGEVEAWHIAPSYRDLLDGDVRLIHGDVVEVDFDRKHLTLERLEPRGQIEHVEYDVLVLAPGSITNFAGVPGAAENSLSFRSLSDADALRRRMIDTLDGIAPASAPQDARRAATFAVVGAGASGVELATKMADLLQDAFRRRGLKGDPRVLVLEMVDRVVPGMDDELREQVEHALLESRVETHTGTRVLAVTPQGLRWEHLEEEEHVDASAVVWTAGVRVNPLVETLALEKTKRNLIVVEPTLQVRGREEVFAIGDVAVLPNLESQNLAGTAQLAYQQGKLAAANVQAYLEGRPLKTEAFKELGEAVSLGFENAAVLAGGHVFDGVLARQARFALYSLRLPTWQHRLRVKASWFFEGTSPRPLGLPMSVA